LYPETGNGGYQSVHTNVNMVYDGGTNTFLPGNNVALTDKATQCLTSFSLDFERTNSDPAGLDMSVSSVTVNGRPARFAFEQPTYPGGPMAPATQTDTSMVSGRGCLVVRQTTLGTRPGPRVHGPPCVRPCGPKLA
jgi:hypothetical protein